RRFTSRRARSVSSSKCLILNHSIVKKFDALLHDYISNKAYSQGLPTVSYFADKCCLSKGYFGELVRVETGRTAKEFISERLLGAAKQLLNDPELSITEVSHRLGFDYPQHFVRFFKAHTGETPRQYRIG
ncbi:MAG: helix-turn-helix domain-containing protein, partial [Muribaculaceae bacterium]